MSHPEPIVISFPEVSEAEGNRLANSLGPSIRELDSSLFVERRRTNPESQDFGATLAIILGSAAIAQLAKGIAAWLARNSGTTIEVIAPNGTAVKIKHASGDDTAQTVAAALGGSHGQ
jgi:hypothetical protein